MMGEGENDDSDDDDKDMEILMAAARNETDEGAKQMRIVIQNSCLNWFYGNRLFLLMGSIIFMLHYINAVN